jgi:DNA-binding MarR family transcriptional regulator
MTPAGTRRSAQAASTGTDAPTGQVAERADAAEVAHRLRLSITRLARILRQQDESGLPPTLASALSTIDSAGPLTLSELAARESVAPPSVTKAVDKLEGRGLVQRRRDERDRRVFRVHVTAAGHKLTATNRSRRTAWLATQIRNLSDDDVACLTGAAEILDRLTGRGGEQVGP